MTSSDGFCSTLTFTAGELGQHYSGEVPTAKQPIPANTTASSSQNTPMATPTALAPPSPFPSSHHRTNSYPVAPSPPPVLSNTTSNPNIRPSSPSRSNSTSSVASHVPGITNNPSLVSGAVPSIAAGSHGFIHSVHTPPQTPRSAASSVNGMGVKRDASESESERAAGGTGGPEKKKRRIAPTNISAGQ